jgi:hypothetical protein
LEEDVRTLTELHGGMVVVHMEVFDLTGHPTISVVEEMPLLLHLLRITIVTAIAIATVVLLRNVEALRSLAC